LELLVGACYQVEHEEVRGVSDVVFDVETVGGGFFQGEAITLTMRAARGLAGGVAIVVRRTPRGAIRTHAGLIMREV
jgi:hypothetical protein